ncbi:amino acid permease [Undibacterium fentianense]|uniref:Amino acid permease n=1 Tax=Undibacterium fentianense TaxID=2828728 RepID=A0A941IE31_9BURK|nr:amino acid permease [Undibacterium fentianense]MBR7800643.1 amino acid permease [Undibacterium fentianense]
MAHNDANFAAIAQRETGLQRHLSKAQMTMIALGGAIGTGLFLGSGFAIGFAGPSVLLSYTIGALIALLLIACLAEMTVAHPGGGSFGALAEFYIHPLAGFLIRYAYWAANVLVIGTEVTAIALYMQFWFPNSPGWYWIVSFSVILVLVNALSVKVFGTIEYWFSSIKVIAILAFLLLGSYLLLISPKSMDIGFHHYTAHQGFLPKGWAGMWLAVIVALFSFLSIEMIAVAAGEAQNPEQAITGAFRSALFRLVTFYLFSLALILAIVPWNQAGREQSPFVLTMQALHIPGAAGFINFVILIAALSAMNSQLYAATRMLFGLARAGFAPSGLGHLNSQGAPIRALVLSCLGIAVATILSIAYPEKAFLLMMAISMFGAMFTWLMIFVTHYFFRRKQAANSLVELKFRMWGFPWLTGIGAILMFALMITTAFTAEFAMTLATGLPFLCGLAGVYWLWYRKAKI